MRLEGINPVGACLQATSHRVCRLQAGSYRGVVNAHPLIMESDEALVSMTIEVAELSSIETLIKRKWWAQQDLNLRPSDYESPALTN